MADDRQKQAAQGTRRAPAPSLTLGDYVAAAFPQTARAISNSRADQGAAWAKGDVARTAGAALRQVVTVPAGVAYDATVPAASALWNGGGRLLGGLVGSDGSTTVNRAFTPPVPAKPVVNPAEAALQAGRKAAETPLTPQEKMMAHLDTLLSRPLTQRGMQAVSGALAETVGTSPRPRAAKDAVLDRTAEISQSVYNNEVKRIMEARASGAMTLAQAREATGKATDAYFLRNTALVGNPLSFAQANMLPAPSDQPEE